MVRLLRAFLGVGLLVATVTAAASAPGGAPRDPYEHFFHKSFGDLSEDLAEARANGKKAVFVFFEMDDCRWCKKMKETILNQADVQDWYNEHFLTLAVDVEGDVEISDLAGTPMTQQQFAINATARNERDLSRPEYKKPTPFFVFFDMNGERIYYVPGIVKGKEEFMQLGRFIVEGAYKTGSFTDYKKAAR